MVVANQLSGLGPGIYESHAIDHIVKTSLQQDEKIGPSNPFLPLGLMKIRSELSFQQTIHPLYFLLLSQLDAVIGELLSPLAVLARGITAPLIGTLVRITAVAFQKQLQILATTNTTYRVSISGQIKPPCLHLG
jgi:hypothetical protein